MIFQIFRENHFYEIVEYIDKNIEVFSNHMKNNINKVHRRRFYDVTINIFQKHNMLFR